MAQTKTLTSNGWGIFNDLNDQTIFLNLSYKNFAKSFYIFFYFGD